MWISLFTVALAIAIGLALGAVVIEYSGDGVRRYQRRRVHHL